MKLEDYFKKKNVSKALYSYRNNVTKKWSIEHKMDLYQKAKVAFNSRKEELEKKSNFSEIYCDLKSYWQVFRPVSADKCWDSNRIFCFFIQETKGFGRENNLTNFSEKKIGHLQNLLEKMHSLKQMNRYPTMAVTKFLHFYNPGLFPIWDNKVVENLVFLVFLDEYKKFCDINKLNSYALGSEFIKNYILYASSFFKGEETKEVMLEYKNFIEKSVNDSYRRKEILKEMQKYYAAAFENICIGAAYIEKPIRIEKTYCGKVVQEFDK